MDLLVVLILIIVGIFRFLRDPNYFRRQLQGRRAYYREYLKSDDWQRKRYVVLKRDNWRCKYCGSKATQVHHFRYAKHNIGKEPIDWLVSVCRPCHEFQHGKLKESLRRVKRIFKTS